MSKRKLRSRLELVRDIRTHFRSTMEQAKRKTDMSTAAILALVDFAHGDQLDRLVQELEARKEAP